MNKGCLWAMIIAFVCAGLCVVGLGVVVMTNKDAFSEALEEAQAGFRAVTEITEELRMDPGAEDVQIQVLMENGQTVLLVTLVNPNGFEPTSDAEWRGACREIGIRVARSLPDSLQVDTVAITLRMQSGGAVQSQTEATFNWPLDELLSGGAAPEPMAAPEAMNDLDQPAEDDPGE